MFMVSVATVAWADEADGAAQAGSQGGETWVADGSGGSSADGAGGAVVGAGDLGDASGAAADGQAGGAGAAQAQAPAFGWGVTVNGFDVGGMDAQAAAAALAAHLESAYRLDLVTREGDTQSLPGAAFGYRVNVPDLGALATQDALRVAGIIAAMDAAGGAWSEIPGAEYGVELTYSYDGAALAEALGTLPCVSGGQVTQSVDASISAFIPGQGFAIVPEVYGNNVYLPNLLGNADAEITHGRSVVYMDAVGAYALPGILSDDPRLQAVRDRLNSYLGISIVYVVGEAQEVIGGEELASWLVPDLSCLYDGTWATFVPGVDSEKVVGFLASLREKYGTTATQVVYQNVAGVDIPVNVVSDYVIDEAAEFPILVDLVRRGESAVRNIGFAAQTVNWNDAGLGPNYVTVDLTNQVVTCYIDGVPVWQQPCVTGNPSRGNATPQGIYTVYAKETNRILRGQRLAGGGYAYESWVNYWMPFNGGIGLHDANWRRSFGGDIYTYNGSHGCVNLPPASVPALYELVQVGTVVVCF
ncbi:MAG: L,D-transpeptidase [Lachnospiraceae bacterium]|jgi:lipoprotein-anchoring transpeptidase ErfK/SrfK|nr:L,D-transpeptidase [Lachnospiraceae bacterium]